MSTIEDDLDDSIYYLWNSKTENQDDDLSILSLDEKLFYFVRKNDLESLKKLSDLNLYGTDNEGRTLLQIACSEGFYDIAEYLISLGFEVKNTSVTILRECFIQKVCDKKKLIKLLVDHNVDVNARDGDSRTAFHLAATAEGDLVTLKYFIDNNIYDNIYDVDISKNNVLHIACIESNISIIEYLLSVDYNINKINNLLQSPLHLSVIKGDILTAKLLLNRNIDIKAKDCGSGNSALHLTSCCNQLDILKYFIDNNIYNIYDVTNYGDNIFHLACILGRYNIVEYLLSIGYDINKTNNDNKSGYTIAVEKGRSNISNLIANYKTKYYD